MLYESFSLIKTLYNMMRIVLIEKKNVATKLKISYLFV